MEDKASNLDAVLKEAVDLVRANSLILLSLSLHVLLAFSCSRGCFLGYRAVRGCPARRGAGALLLLLLPQFVACVHPSFRGVFLV